MRVIVYKRCGLFLYDYIRRNFALSVIPSLQFFLEEISVHCLTNMSLVL